MPPKFSVSFDVPQLDMHHRWFADYEKVTMPPDWNATVETRLGRSLPVVGFLNDNDRNRMTVSCSEANLRLTSGASAVHADMLEWNVNDSAFAECGMPDKPVFVINATGRDRLVVELQAAPSAVEAFDTFGKKVGAPVLKAGINSVAMSASGYLKIMP